MAGHPMDELQAAVMQPERETNTCKIQIRIYFVKMYCDGDMKIVFLMNFIPLEVIFTPR